MCRPREYRVPQGGPHCTGPLSDGRLGLGILRRGGGVAQGSWVDGHDSHAGEHDGARVAGSHHDSCRALGQGDPAVDVVCARDQEGDVPDQGHEGLLGEVELARGCWRARSDVLSRRGSPLLLAADRPLHGA
ncbi:hypothetical protein EB118_09310 [bacterium]|nr:hypothetical protein [bacterium]